MKVLASKRNCALLYSKSAEQNLGVFVVTCLLTNDILIISDFAHDFVITIDPPSMANW